MDGNNDQPRKNLFGCMLLLLNCIIVVANTSTSTGHSSKSRSTATQHSPYFAGWVGVPAYGTEFFAVVPANEFCEHEFFSTCTFYTMTLSFQCPHNYHKAQRTIQMQDLKNIMRSIKVLSLPPKSRQIVCF